MPVILSRIFALVPYSIFNRILLELIKVQNLTIFREVNCKPIRSILKAAHNEKMVFSFENFHLVVYISVE